MLQFCFSRDPRCPFGMVFRNIRLSGITENITTITTTERQSISYYKISTSYETWVWIPVVLEFPVQLSKSFIMFVLQLPTCKVVLPYTRKGFYKKHVLFVWDKEVLIVITYGRGLYCARHCTLLMILYSPYSSSMASHYSHKSGGSKLTWSLLPF